MTIIYWTASWLSGIWLASNFPMSWFFWLIPCAVGILCAILLRRKPVPRRFSVYLVIICLGALRYNQTILPKADNHISNFNEVGNITLTGVVASEPDVRDTTTNLLVEAESLSTVDGGAMPVIGQVLVRVPRYPVIAYGSRVQISGSLKAPVNNSDFDYAQYLARRNIFSEMLWPEIVVLETDVGNPIIELILAIKAHAQDTIDLLFSEPQAALLSGILLGYDRGLPKELAEDFRATGTTHIIAISGINIAIIAGILLIGSRYIVPFRTAAWVTIIGIAIYTIFIGADVSVVRAAAMGILLIIATHIMGRPIFLPAIIFTAALVMTLINPNILWDVGFQLSFAATLGLALYIGPWSQRIEAGMQPLLNPNAAQRITRLITEVVLATIAAMIMTLPIMIYHFDTLSIISPLANLLILPAQPGVMCWGGLATILGSFLPILGQVPAWVAWLFLSYITSLVRFFAGLPLTTVPISYSINAVVVSYALILGLTWFSDQEVRKRISCWATHVRRDCSCRLSRHRDCPNLEHYLVQTTPRWEVTRHLL